MNKFMYFAASAALALASCSKDELISEGAQAPLEDGQVGFSAYVGRNTRAAADIIDNNYLKVNGFGVYAFEQGTTPWNTYRASNTYPNFFYNQKVAYEDIESFDLKNGISTSEFENIDNATLHGYYTSESTGSKWDPVRTTDQDGLDALLAIPGLTIADYVDLASVSVTPKPKITKAEYDAGSSGLKAIYAGAGSDPVTGYLPIASVTGTHYNALTVAERAAYCTITTVTLVNQRTYAQLQAINDAPRVKALYSEQTAGKRNPSTSTWSLDNYKLLKTNLDRSLCEDYNIKASGQDNFLYSPIKYFSNNVGAKHSFFAYAPYAKNITAVFTNEGPTIRYNGSESYDLLWAEPILNKEKAGITERLMFNFKHALSKVSFKVSTFVDKVHNGTPSHGLSVIDENTTITLRSVKFAGVVPSKGLLNLANGSWKIESSDENVYEFAPEDAIVLNKENLAYWNDGETAMYVPVSEDNMVIPTTAENKIKVQVVYDVVTRDASNPQNSSSVTNTVKSEEEFELQSGIAYMFKLDLGLTSVKFDAEVVDWTAPEIDKTVDLPNNHGLNAMRTVNVNGIANKVEIGSTLTELTENPSTTNNGDVNYNPINKSLYVYNSGWAPAATNYYFYKQSTGVLFKYNSTNSNWDRYVVDAVEIDTHSYALLSAPATAITVIELQSTATNSKGEVQQIDGTWITPVNNNYYRVGDKLYKWINL